MERAVGGNEVEVEEVQVGEARKGRLKCKLRLIKCLEVKGSGDNFPKSSVVVVNVTLQRLLYRCTLIGTNISLLERVVLDKKIVNVWI